MKNILAVAASALALTAVGAYAANLSSASANTLGGTGAVDVVAPTTSAVKVKWTLASGKISAAVLNWTPDGTGTADFTTDISVYSDNTCTTLLTSGTTAETAVTKGTARNTSVTLGSPTEAQDIECVKAVIVQQ